MGEVKMKKITLTLSMTDYPIVLKTYGLEGAKAQAVRMCTTQSLEVTEMNLYSVLTNLEDDLENQTALMQDEDE